METILNFCKRILIGLIVLLQIQFASAQYCDSITPSFNVDLSASAQSNWISPSIQRDGNCCGTSAPDVCLEFIILLHPDATSINFNIASGAIPPGALFYQIDCGPQIPVGNPICLDGAGPHHLTFCKPGNNTNSFEIVSYSAPVFGPDIVLNAACSNFIYANYYDESTVTWNSISPGAPGNYNGLLSCESGCDTTYVTAPTLPLVPQVDYLVCGMDANGCNPLPICDTISVSFIDPVEVIVNPVNYHLCFGDPAVEIVASASGGSGAYSYSWSSGETTSSIFANGGVYQVNVTDTSGCLVATATSTITQDLLPITAEAGADQAVCSSTVGSLSLNGAVQTATGGIWTNGNGVFSPSNSVLNPTYTPTAEEIADGEVILYLETTGNNGCTSAIDSVIFSFLVFEENIQLVIENVSCMNDSDGVATVSTTGTFSPSEYSLNGGSASTNGNFTGLSAGNYSLQIINSMGCDTTINFTITQPPLLTGELVNQENVLCNGNATGSLEVQALGGTSSYTYSWNTVPSQFTATAINLSAGNYECTITDANGCQTLVLGTIVEPAPLSINFSIVEPNCFGATNGAISSFITGGTQPYNFNWSTGAISSNLYDVGTGNYGLIVTDSNQCQATANAFVGEPIELTASITPASEICPESSIDLSVIGTGGTGTYSYLWNPGLETTPTINVSPIHDQEYTCMISDNNGCSTIVSTMVTINYLNPDDLQAIINVNEICFGDTVQLNANYTGSDETLTLSWLHCPCNPATTVYDIPTQSTQYILRGVNYCNDTIYDTVYVDVNQLPIIELNPTFGNVCPNEPILFQNIGDNDPNWLYEWTFGNGDTGSGMNSIYTYTQSGDYMIGLTLTDDNGCTSEFTGSSFAIVYPQANADFVMSATSVSFLEPTVQFYNASSNATEFLWRFGDGNESNQVNAEHTYTESSPYIVSLYATNEFGCPDSTWQLLTIRPAFDLYVPNAFTPDGDDHNNSFNPKSFGVSEEDYTFQIFNRWGELIFESHDPEMGWDGKNNGELKTQDGVFSWIVYFKDLGGGKHMKKGHVSVLR